MRNTAKFLLTSASAIAMLGVITATPVLAASHSGGKMSSVEVGKQLAFNRKKGNCLGCHMIAGGQLPGDIGPPLVAMKARFPDKAKLRQQIADATIANPNSMMPPFGRHGALSAKEIDAITDFIHTL